MCRSQKYTTSQTTLITSGRTLSSWIWWIVFNASACIRPALRVRVQTADMSFYRDTGVSSQAHWQDVIPFPLIIRDTDDDSAIIMVVDGNIQRETIMFSEKAKAYRMKLEALKRQGARTDLTSSQVGMKLKNKQSSEILAEKSNDSKNQIYRYIRLTELTPPLLEMVDDKKIAFTPAVELSYLPQELQTELLDIIEQNECTPSLSQAQRLKQAAQEGKLDRNGIELVMSEEKPQQNNVTIKGSRLEKYFSKDFTPRQKEDIIIKALDLYYKKLERAKQEKEYER